MFEIGTHHVYVLASRVEGLKMIMFSLACPLNMLKCLHYFCCISETVPADCSPLSYKSVAMAVLGCFCTVPDLVCLNLRCGR